MSLDQNVAHLLHQQREAELVQSLESRRRADELIAARRTAKTQARASQVRTRRPGVLSWLHPERPTTLASA
ncbi:hypothetical protein [Xylanimonas sp. McL0601]|uniref:hypothetical protein n=1 Tax=Xylanimonas sp. McL0601 TaxID=3414739 RepID=UPI003CF55F3E